MPRKQNEVVDWYVITSTAEYLTITHINIIK